MGHRHQTYVLVTDMVNKETDLTVYHSQWNYPLIQMPKVLRFVKYFKPILKDTRCCDSSFVALIYLYTASLSPARLLRTIDITEEFTEYSNHLCCEDNNNGWTLIHVKLYDDTKKNVMLIGFKPGSEDNSGDHNFMNLFKYLKLILNKDETIKFNEDKDYTDEDRRLLRAINRMGNASKLEESVSLLKTTADSLYKATT